MARLQQLFSRSGNRPAKAGVQGGRSESLRASDGQFDMGAALVFGLERRNGQLHFVEHCARVADLVEKMSTAFSLSRSEREDLLAAARLHEIGMIGVPSELVASPSALDSDSIGRLRAQATIGANILAATQSARTCLLVKYQYCNFEEMRVRFKPGSRDVLLAGILRAADVLDTMLHPRPYQADLDPALTAQILLRGRGTMFHPQAVESLLQLQVMN